MNGYIQTNGTINWLKFFNKEGGTPLASYARLRQDLSGKNMVRNLW